ncbi:MAG: peptidylprolyl isomerase [Eubacteriales bacterium]|nr:peptidylprolyl isomerase [Eubacteriales bacterium]
MRKRVFLTLLLAAALVLTTSCSLIVKDAAVDQHTVIIEAAGKTYTKGEVNAQVQNALDYQAYMYSAYGMSFDPTSSEAISSAQDSVINALIQEAVVEQKQTEMGLDVFTDEETKTLQETVDTTYQSYVDAVKSSDFADTTLTGEELDTAVAAKMVEYGYPTKDDLLASQKAQAGQQKLKDEVVKDVAVTEDELKAEYDTRVSDAKTQYETTLSAYGTAVQNGTTVYYAPAGYRYVKHILRNFAEADNTKISDLNTQISSKQTQLTNVTTSLSELGEDASADDEAAAKSRKELTDTQTTLNTEIADLQAQLDAAKEAGYAALQPTIEEIQTKIAAGEDFDALVAEYGEDPGMKSEPALTNGYLVCADSTNWVTEFKDASMALAAIGDVSEPVRSSYGIHIIKYVSDVTEGPVAYDDVKDTIQSELLQSKQDQLYNDTVAQWVTEANAKTYKERLAD